LAEHWRKRVGLAVLAALGVMPVAQAQIYISTGEDGVIVLSSSADGLAPQLLIPADNPALRGVTTSAPAPNLERLAPIPENYRSFVQEASATYRLPVALIHAVIAVESGYNPHAVSLKGAQGLMQLMPATARRFGNTNVWDPRNNILTGSRYLRWLLDFFGQNLELSLAAYNAGEGAVIRAGRQIPRYTETEKYVPKVLLLFHRAQRQI
jgi:soluble lytic murein transglycosylase-like protein